MDKEINICSFTAKRCYTQKEASIALNFAKKHTRHTDIPKRSYHCEYCGFWHLTSSQNERHRQKKQIKILNPQEDFDLSKIL